MQVRFKELASLNSIIAHVRHATDFFDSIGPQRIALDPLHVGFRRRSGIDNHGALTICLHAGGNPASVKAGLGLLGGGCSVDSLNQKSNEASPQTDETC